MSTERGNPAGGSIPHGSARGRGLVASEISSQMVRLYARYTGRGPTKARTTINTNLVVVVFEGALTKAEANLVGAGESEAVLSMRRTFHRAMCQEAVKVVEERLERAVISVLADTDPEASIAVTVFVLEPVPDDGRAYVGDATGEATG